MPPVSRVLIYPFKSLDGQEVRAAAVLPSGALAHDRAFALVDEDGNFVNAKRHAAIHRLRASLDIDGGRLTLRDESDRGLGTETFDLADDRRALLDWLAAFFGFRVALREDRDKGFPDDPDSPGPTIISTATLAEIAAWYDLPIDQVRARFRTNIEVEGVPAFWEDRLFGAADEEVAFAIGGTRFKGINPCQRCVVPTRHPWTGAPDKTFAKRFGEARRRSLPAWSTRQRFDHFYRVAINTRIASWQADATIGRGDLVGAFPD